MEEDCSILLVDPEIAHTASVITIRKIRTREPKTMRIHSGTEFFPFLLEFLEPFCDLWLLGWCSSSMSEEVNGRLLFTRLHCGHFMFFPIQRHVWCLYLFSHTQPGQFFPGAHLNFAGETTITFAQIDTPTEKKRFASLPFFVPLYLFLKVLPFFFV
jgi:hypothetical protein